MSLSELKFGKWICWFWLAAALAPSGVCAQMLTITNAIRSYSALTNTAARFYRLLKQ